MNLSLGISTSFSGEHVSPEFQWLHNGYSHDRNIQNSLGVFRYVLTHTLMPVFTSSAFRKGRNAYEVFE